MKQEVNDYLSDQELESLITEIETGQMKQAPEYLEQMILRNAKRNAVKVSVEIIPIRTAIKEGTPVLPNKQSKWVQLFTYSAKIIAAAAAAIAIVLTLPQAERNTGRYTRTTNIEQEQIQKERHSVLHEFNTITGEFCNSIFEKTNLIFQREDKTDDTEKE